VHETDDQGQSTKQPLAAYPAVAAGAAWVWGLVLAGGWGLGLEVLFGTFRKDASSVAVEPATVLFSNLR
jgi:hypothetical protein